MGLVPMSPVTEVAPVLVMPALVSRQKSAAVPRLTAARTGLGGGGDGDGGDGGEGLGGGGDGDGGEGLGGDGGGGLGEGGGGEGGGGGGGACGSSEGMPGGSKGDGDSGGDEGGGLGGGGDGDGGGGVGGGGDGEGGGGEGGSGEGGSEGGEGGSEGGGIGGKIELLSTDRALSSRLRPADTPKRTFSVDKLPPSRTFASSAPPCLVSESFTLTLRRVLLPTLTPSASSFGTSATSTVSPSLSERVNVVLPLCNARRRLVEGTQDGEMAWQATTSFSTLPSSPS